MKALILGLFLFSSTVLASELPESLAGMTFSYPGPNCFGVAMYVNKNTSVIRGVDLSEFTEFVREKCVPIQQPKRGDIGTFHNKSDFIHAFVYLGNNRVLEKTGVDYLGKTPLLHRELSHTIYTFEASPECRRWGAGSRDCFNDLQYYRCQQGQVHSFDELYELEGRIEALMQEMLRGSAQNTASLSLLIDLYKEKVASLEDPFLLGRLESFQKQLEFLLR